MMTDGQRRTAGAFFRACAQIYGMALLGETWAIWQKLGTRLEYRRVPRVSKKDFLAFATDTGRTDGVYAVVPSSEVFGPESAETQSVLIRREWLPVPGPFFVRLYRAQGDKLFYVPDDLAERDAPAGPSLGEIELAALLGDLRGRNGIPLRQLCISDRECEALAAILPGESGRTLRALCALPTGERLMQTLRLGLDLGALDFDDGLLYLQSRLDRAGVHPTGAERGELYNRYHTFYRCRPMPCHRGWCPKDLAAMPSREQINALRRRERENARRIAALPPLELLFEPGV